MSTPLTINSVETLQEALPLIRASQEAYSNFTQEQVDAICEKTAMAVSKMRIPLAKMACEETGYGIVVDKVTKNQYALSTSGTTCAIKRPAASFRRTEPSV